MVEEGSKCLNKNCLGFLKIKEAENCSCHINPPCSSCVNNGYKCDKCFDVFYNEIINDYECISRNDGVIFDFKPRKLDSTKIDYGTKSHTHFSQIHEGVYPEGTTLEQVLEKVKGTFGGRFNYFGNGKFEYVAYTD